MEDLVKCGLCGYVYDEDDDYVTVTDFTVCINCWYKLFIQIEDAKERDNATH